MPQSGYPITYGFAFPKLSCNHEAKVPVTIKSILLLWCRHEKLTPGLLKQSMEVKASSQRRPVNQQFEDSACTSE